MWITRERGRLVSAAALGSVAATAVPFVLSTGSRFALLFAVVNAFGAAAIARRSITSQVLGQGVAVALVASQGANVLAHRATPLSLGFMGAGVLAVMAALPFWSTKGATERFAPLVGRRTFVAGAVISVAIAMRLLVASLIAVTNGFWYFAFLGVLLGAMLVAQATAVARMRGWGVLLATATAAACLVPALALHGQAAWLCAFAAAASAALVAPVIAAVAGIVRPPAAQLQFELEPDPLAEAAHTTARIELQEHEHDLLEPQAQRVRA